MPTVSLPTAEFLFNVSSVALIAGALAVFAGTIGTVWMGSVKERYGDERIAANERETAQAQRDAADANERAGKANEAAAELRVRAGSLEKDAAQARTEQEHLKARNLEMELQIIAQGPRNIAVGQAQKIASSIRSEVTRPKIIFDYFNETESHRFKNILGQAFRDAGLMCDAGAAFVNTIPPGVQVWDQSGVVQRALNAAGIQFQDLSVEDRNNATTIQVGPKQY